MEKKSRRSDLMEQELLACAAELFSVGGFGGTSMREIAEKAGVGRTTLYHYFSSKDDLLVTLVEDLTQRSYQDLCEICDRNDLSPADQLLAAVTILSLRVLEEPMRFRLVARDETKLPKAMFEQQIATKRAALEILVGIIEAGIRAGELRAVDPQLAGLSIFGMCNWPAWWFRPDSHKSAAEISAQIADMAMASLRIDGGVRKDTPARVIDSIKADLDLLSGMKS